MKSIYSIMSFTIILVLLLTACGASPGQVPEAAETETNLPVANPMEPSEEPTKESTPTTAPSDTPIPTDTPEPTATLTATRTKRPTNTPTITPTPGPYSFFDDFSTDSGGWEDCEGCIWKDGTLVMGPYDPSSFFHINYCTGCMDSPFYRMSVDVTFIDGQVDRFFGVIFADGPEYVYYLGISPWGFYTIDRWYWEQSYWENMSFAQSDAVLGGYATNHIEVIVQPATNPEYADYYIYINDKLVKVIYTMKVEPTWVGLGMNFHAQVAAYDNWEYVVIEP